MAKVSSVAIRSAPKDGKRFRIIASGDIEFPEMGMAHRGCSLALEGRKIVALPPKVSHVPYQLVVWDTGGPLARQAANALLDAFCRLGGKLPDEDGDPEC